MSTAMQLARVAAGRNGGSIQSSAPSDLRRLGVSAVAPAPTAAPAPRI